MLMTGRGICDEEILMLFHLHHIQQYNINLFKLPIQYHYYLLPSGIYFFIFFIFFIFLLAYIILFFIIIYKKIKF